MSKKGGVHQCNIRTFDSKIMQLCRDAALPRKACTTCAAALQRDVTTVGIPVKTISKWMGHASESQTWEYIILYKVDDADAIEIAKLDK